MLWTVSIVTGKQEPLLDLGEGIQYATLSPDGSQVAYNFIQNGVINVWIASVHDGQRKQLTFDEEMAGFPCWSADGQWIAYEKKRGRDDYLMLMPSNGGQPIQLTSDKELAAQFLARQQRDCLCGPTGWNLEHLHYLDQHEGSEATNKLFADEFLCSLSDVVI